MTADESSSAGAAPAGGAPDPEAALQDLVRNGLFGRWQEPPPDQMTSRRVEMRRLADSMRIIIERLVATAAPTETIIEVADQLAHAALAFDHWPHGTLYEGFAEAANAGGDPHAMFEHSPFIGRANPLAPPIRLIDLEGVLHGHVNFGSAYEGPPGCVHGGYIAGAFDELLGATQSLSGNPGMTARLIVNYRSPTPLHAELHLIGRLSGVDGRKIFTEGQLFAIQPDGSEQLCAEAEGLFIGMAFGRFDDLIAARAEAERDRLEGR
jgi:acyl-coenzyme A thioesterase PaaI-like protein